MKKDFKTKIDEIAAKIAEVDSPNKVTADADKVNDIIDSITRLESPLGMINSAAEAKDVVLHIMGMMSNLSDSGKRTALNQALTAMATAAADKTMSDMGVEDASLNEARYDMTYHLQMKRPSDVTKTILHKDLPDAVRSYLENEKVAQNKYYVSTHGQAGGKERATMFIYLDRGDRVDVDYNPSEYVWEGFARMRKLAGVTNDSK